MSMELYILSDVKVESIGDWQQAIDANRSALLLSAQRPLANVRGALPVIINGLSTSFECDPWDADEIMADAPDIRFGHRWKYALALRWGGNINAAAGAYTAAAAYARATDGVILDCEEGKLISPQRALDISAEIAGSRSQIEAAVRFVTEQFRK